MIAGLEPEIRRIFGELLDNMKGKTRIDVVDDFAFPGPVTVICKVLGLPLESIRASTAGSRPPSTAWTSARRRATPSSSAALRRALLRRSRSSSSWATC